MGSVDTFLNGTSCKEVFHLLLNVEKATEEPTEVHRKKGHLQLYMVEVVRKQLEKIGLKKPCGSDDLGETGAG